MEIQYLMKKNKNSLFILFILPLYLYPQTRPPLLVSPLTLTPKQKVTPTITEVPNEEAPLKEKTPSTWGGSNLTREEKNVDGETLHIFTLSGGAWLLHKQVRLISDSIEVIGEDAHQASLKGKVVVEDKENGITLHSSGAKYDKLKETIELEGRSKLVFIDKNKKKSKVMAGHIIRKISESKTELVGGVIIENEDFTILSDSAIFLEKEKLLVMDNYPFIFGKKSFLNGEKIIYSTEKGTTSIENETHIFSMSMEVPKKKEKQEENKEETIDKEEDSESEEQEPEKQKVISVFMGDKLVHTKSKTDNSIVMVGNAAIYRPDSTFNANKVVAKGKDNKDIDGLGSVSFLDKDNKTRIKGEKLEHREELQYTHITENPQIEFLDNTLQNVQAKLTAIEIERFGEKKELVARGNVKIESEKLVAMGEYATLYEDSKKLEIYGNPRIIRDNKEIQCGKIVFFIEENRAIITEGIKLNKSDDK